MALFNNEISKLLDQRIQWLSIRAEVLTGNIAKADLIKAKRQELKPFRQIVEEFVNKRGSFNKAKAVDEIQVDRSNIFQTKKEISRDLEMLEFTNNAVEQEAFVGIMKKLHHLFQVAASKSQ
jgi:flagellar basal body rod protein FlgB